jgi:hypothetical protein
LVAAGSHLGARRPEQRLEQRPEQRLGEAEATRIVRISAVATASDWSRPGRHAPPTAHRRRPLLATAA